MTQNLSQGGPHTLRVSQPTGLARGLERALSLESVRLDVREHRPGPAYLLNPRRLELVLTAAAYPGVHLRSASRLLLSPLPSLRYHVKALEAHRLLRTWRSGKRVHLFVPGMYPMSAEPFLAAWEEPFDRRVVSLIHAAPGVPRSVLDRQVVPDSRHLDRSLDRLESLGAIRIRTSRGEPRYWVTPRWTRFERLCHDGVPARLQRFLQLLRGEGLHPILEEATADHVRMSVDGPRFRIRFALPLDPINRDRKA